MEDQEAEEPILEETGLSQIRGTMEVVDQKLIQGLFLIFLNLLSVILPKSE